VNKKATQSLGRKVVTEVLGDGLQVTDTTVGKGDVAQRGDLVEVKYSGKLVTTGKEIDAGHIKFVLGAGSVIKGWDQGLQGLKVGGQRLLVVPPSLAYGDKAHGEVPAKSTLEYEVELVNAKKPVQKN
jgi:FK506-binding nuclear protein